MPDFRARPTSSSHGGSSSVRIPASHAVLVRARVQQRRQRHVAANPTDAVKIGSCAWMFYSPQRRERTQRERESLVMARHCEEPQATRQSPS